MANLDQKQLTCFSVKPNSFQLDVITICIKEQICNAPRPSSTKTFISSQLAMVKTGVYVVAHNSQL